MASRMESVDEHVARIDRANISAAGAASDGVSRRRVNAFMAPVVFTDTKKHGRTELDSNGRKQGGMETMGGRVFTAVKNEEF